MTFFRQISGILVVCLCLFVQILGQENRSFWFDEAEASIICRTKNSLKNEPRNHFEFIISLVNKHNLDRNKEIMRSTVPDEVMTPRKAQNEREISGTLFVVSFLVFSITFRRFLKRAQYPFAYCSLCRHDRKKISKKEKV